jgi:hypothetical protein
MTKQVALAAILLALVTCELDAAPAAELRTIPDPTLIPGVVETTDAAAVCQPGYAKAHRHVSTALRGQVFAAYGVPLAAAISSIGPPGAAGAWRRQRGREPLARALQRAAERPREGRA